MSNRPKKMKNLLGAGVLDGHIRTFPKFLHITDPFWDLFDTIFQSILT